MKKRYTITFNPALQNIDEPLRQIERFGVEVQSAQHFIGTAVVKADAVQLKKVKSIDAVHSIIETGTVKVM